MTNDELQKRKSDCQSEIKQVETQAISRIGFLQGQVALIDELLKVETENNRETPAA